MANPRLSLVTRLAAVVVALSWLGPAAGADARCGAPGGTYLQVLGSGGPIADDGRASSAYLVWIDGKTKVLVDAGGGAFLRFGEAHATFVEVDLVAISHFHTDHSADLVTLLKTGYFSDRRRPLAVSGPGPRGPFPDLEAYLAANIGAGGAYAYLSGYLDGSGGLVELRRETLDPDGREGVPVGVPPGSGFSVEAIGVPHGIVPTIGYRVTIGEKSIVFASDQNGNDETFVDFARDADILVMHMVVPEGISGAGRALHAPPGRIGEIGAAAGADTLVLSHFMARSLANLEENIAAVRQQFGGKIVIAEDLLCIPVGGD